VRPGKIAQFRLTPFPLFLVSACSPEEAYDKAMRLGREGETTYGNPAGRAVRHSFRGVAQLDTLVDGELVKNGDRLCAAPLR
jgi:hypothetical protein